VRSVAAARVAALLILGASAGAAEDEWRDVIDKDGIVVSVLEQPDRVLPLLRGVTVIPAGPTAISDVIRDVARQCEWMHQCKEARILEETPEAVFIYNRTGLPWPVADRDTVLRTELHVIEPDVEVRAVASSTDQVSVPEVPGVVRMPYLRGEFRLRIQAPGETRVEYRLDIDPGGRIPIWLVKRTSRDIPFYTLRNLRKRVAELAD
jgi:hypothetical protein